MQDGISGKQRERLIDSLKAEAIRFVDGPLFNSLSNRFTEVLGEFDEWSIRADIENPDNANIFFGYPANEEPSEYLKIEVLLELGARGDTWPTVNGTVRPYAAELFPDQFEHADAPVQAISAQRTFWEKVTLLHSLVHLGEERMVKAKPARHLYDVYQLANNELGREAILDTELLASVVEHKKVFYKRTASKYELAVPGTLRVLPSKELAGVLRPEYEQMTEIMIFGDTPKFDVVVDALIGLEAEIND
ncbi:MAG: nucleotidyl transferase AbiEii/AbiGii toxin family protein [Phycisphaerales bacterium]|nr:nucleotidyl transferase AbiEii/AbiGii toxin family protein [Phycisphaerales bacterium]